jgi:hypothetical protein
MSDLQNAMKYRIPLILENPPRTLIQGFARILWQT